MRKLLVLLAVAAAGGGWTWAGHAGAASGLSFRETVTEFTPVGWGVNGTQPGPVLSDRWVYSGVLTAGGLAVGRSEGSCVVTSPGRVDCQVTLRLARRRPLVASGAVSRGGGVVRLAGGGVAAVRTTAAAGLVRLAAAWRVTA